MRIEKGDLVKYTGKEEGLHDREMVVKLNSGNGWLYCTPVDDDATLSCVRKSDVALVHKAAEMAELNEDTFTPKGSRVWEISIFVEGHHVTELMSNKEEAAIVIDAYDRLLKRLGADYNIGELHWIEVH